MHYIKLRQTERCNTFYSRNQIPGLLTDSLVHKRWWSLSLLCVTSCTTNAVFHDCPRPLSSVDSSVTFSVTSQSSMRRTKQCNNPTTVSFEREEGGARVPEHDTRNHTLSGIVQPGSRYRWYAVDIDPQRRLVSATKASFRLWTGFNTVRARGILVGEQLVRYVCGHTFDGSLPFSSFIIYT